VLAVVILWFYGSFWTSAVIVLGGHIPQLIHNLFGIKLIQVLQFVNAEIPKL
jgi:hypothetical protein